MRMNVADEIRTRRYRTQTTPAADAGEMFREKDKSPPKVGRPNIAAAGPPPYKASEAAELVSGSPSAN